MDQAIGLVTVVVREYDEALDFYVKTLGFILVEDSYVPEQDKRWVVVAPPGSTGVGLVLGRAVPGVQRPDFRVPMALELGKGLLQCHP